MNRYRLNEQLCSLREAEGREEQDVRAGLFLPLAAVLAELCYFRKKRLL